MKKTYIQPTCLPHGLASANDLLDVFSIDTDTENTVTDPNDIKSEEPNDKWYEE